MDSPPPERQLVRLVFTLPPEGDELAVTGMVARITPGKPPGVGIRFYALDPQALKRWERFVRHAASGARVEARPAPLQPPARPSLPTGAPVTADRSFPRYTAAVPVRLRSIDELTALYTRNISKGGAFIRTSVVVAPGTPVRLLIVHPATGLTFPLEAVVRRQSGAPDPGLAVEFVELSEQRRDEFFEFILSQLPADDAVLVDPAGPPRSPAVPPPPPGDLDD